MRADRPPVIAPTETVENEFPHLRARGNGAINSRHLLHARAADRVRGSSSTAWAKCAWLLGVSLPAAASDMSGISAVFIGIPGMALAALLFGVLAGVPRRHPAVYAITAVVAAVVLLPLGWLMGSDALATLHKGYPAYAVTYFGLYALAAVLFVVFTVRFVAHRRALRAAARH